MEKIKVFVICTVCSLIVGISTASIVKRQFMEIYGDYTFNKLIMEHCSKIGFSPNWKIGFSTTTPGTGNFSCFEKAKGAEDNFFTTPTGFSDFTFGNGNYYYINNPL